MLIGPLIFNVQPVALRKESVDRNYAKETPPHITQRSLSARRAWIEMPLVPRWRLDQMSLSARRAWIEMLYTFTRCASQRVALRKESVDRNIQKLAHLCLKPVALRKESVDRNLNIRNPTSTRPSVALRKESVDRNEIGITAIDGVIESLSARRAWIEIAEDWLNASTLSRRSPQGERG